MRTCPNVKVAHLLSAWAWYQPWYQLSAPRLSCHRPPHRACHCAPPRGLLFTASCHKCLIYQRKRGGEGRQAGPACSGCQLTLDDPRTQPRPRPVAKKMPKPLAALPLVAQVAGGRRPPLLSFCVSRYRHHRRYRQHTHPYDRRRDTPGEALPREGCRRTCVMDEQRWPATAPAPDPRHQLPPLPCSCS